MQASFDDPYYKEGDPFLQHFLPGESSSIRTLRGYIYRLNVAHRNKRLVPAVLLLGEPGTGKTFISHLIAAHSYWLQTEPGMRGLSPDGDSDVYGLAKQAGIRVQTLTALPESLAELILFGAKKGAYTGSEKDIVGLFDCDEPVDLVLDEIGDAPLSVQAKLLEVLENRSFRPLGTSFNASPKYTEARIIAATNQDLRKLVVESGFRADLYDRLSWARIVLPPLRDQIDQIEVFIRQVNRDLCQQFDLDEASLSDDDVRWSATYHWPGNYRELKQVIWEWHLYDRSESFRSIVERRGEFITADNTLREAIEKEVPYHLESILNGTEPSFRTFGKLGNLVKQYAYEALWRFHQRRRLSDSDLKRLFTNQPPISVRKQISAKRPKEGK